MGLFGVIPAAMDVADHLSNIDESLGISRWAYLLLLLGLVQVAYAIYVVQLPDWSTVWVIAVMSLIVASGYAMFLAVTLLASHQSSVLRALDLHRVAEGRAGGWCFIMLCTTCLTAYFAGRLSVRWRRDYQRLSGSASA